MEDLIELFRTKVDKHERKLKAHKEAEAILKANYEELKEKDFEKAKRVGEKLLSTIKSVEYHTAKYKAYKKVVEALEAKVQKV